MLFSREEQSVNRAVFHLSFSFFVSLCYFPFGRLFCLPVQLEAFLTPWREAVIRIPICGDFAYSNTYAPHNVPCFSDFESFDICHCWPATLAYWMQRDTQLPSVFCSFFPPAIRFLPFPSFGELHPVATMTFIWSGSTYRKLSTMSGTIVFFQQYLSSVCLRLLATRSSSEVMGSNHNHFQ